MDEDLAAHVADGRAHGPDLDERLRAVLAFTDAFVGHPDDVGDDVREDLLRHLDPSQVVELALILGAFLGFSKLRVALGLVPDQMEVRVVPTPQPDDTNAPPDRS